MHLKRTLLCLAIFTCQSALSMGEETHDIYRPKSNGNQKNSLNNSNQSRQNKEKLNSQNDLQRMITEPLDDGVSQPAEALKVKSQSVVSIEPRNTWCCSWHCHNEIEER